MSEYRFLYWDEELPKELYSDSKVANEYTNQNNNAEVFSSEPRGSEDSTTSEYIESKRA